jgi:hypothetical protein
LILRFDGAKAIRKGLQREAPRRKVVAIDASQVGVLRDTIHDSRNLRCQVVSLTNLLVEPFDEVSLIMGLFGSDGRDCSQSVPIQIWSLRA